MVREGRRTAAPVWPLLSWSAAQLVAILTRQLAGPESGQPSVDVDKASDARRWP